MSAQEPGADFDLAAAGLRADGGDLSVSLEVLARKLEESLPAQTRVERRGGGLLHRGVARVCELRVQLGENRYRLTVDGPRLDCTREREVGGISIKRESLDPSVWVSALAQELQAEAARSAEARAALSSLLD